MALRRIMHISDWHTDENGFESRLLAISEKQFQLPDLILVTGDMIYDPQSWNYNHVAAALDQRPVWEQMSWILSRYYQGVPIVAVPGNHDWCDYAVEGRVQSFDTPLPKVIEVDGLRIGGFRGVPMINGRWNTELEPRAFDWLLAELDRDIDILVTHTPPHGKLDRVYDTNGLAKKTGKFNVGAPGIHEWCQESPRLRLNVFGHIHECGGRTEVYKHVTYSNASMKCNDLLIDFQDKL